MRTLYVPVLMVIGGNVVYHLAQRSVPRTANPLVIVIVAWAIASLLCATALLVGPSSSPVGETLRTLSWSTVALGVGIALVEIGVLLAYRFGMKVSVLPVLSSTGGTLFLLPIGLLFFREQLTARGLLGIAFCLAGLFLLRV